MTGIYIHIPLCAKKCPYCDFYSTAYSKSVAESYVAALCRNIEEYRGKGISADTVYFGGGTPSLLTPEQIFSVINSVDRAFVLHNPEITLEANPCTVNQQKLTGYKGAGINRLSYGVQSANDNELKLLGRLHSFDMARQAVENAVTAGFDNISCDIMLGTQGQTVESLGQTVEKITALPIQHISAYMLKIEEGTAFDNEAVRKAVADDDTLADMYLSTVERLEKAGFSQYEISNFAKTGFESRHNMKYWTGEDYIGFGASAHSFYEGRRYFCKNDIKGFIESTTQPVEILEENPDRLEEYVMLGLRTKQGISLEKLCHLGGKVFADRVLEKAETFSLHGLCKVNKGVISLTPEGFLLSNDIIGEFIELQ